ncbi:MAG: alpha/beta fold hydrolase [Alphaproteobacteria bacterium]
MTTDRPDRPTLSSQSPPRIRRTVRPAPERVRHRRWGLLHAAALVVTLPSCVPGPDMAEEERQTLERRSVSVPALPPATSDPVTISYLEGGTAGAPRVIYVHGTPGEAMGWADYLGPDAPFEAIALDRPGFGESGPDTQAVTSLAAQAAALLPLLKAVDGIKPILVGHSLGGPIVARAAIDYPDRVGGLVIAAGSLDPDLEKINPMQWVGEWIIIRSLLPRAIRNANRELLALEPELRILAGALDRIIQPTVIVHGTRDDLVPYANVAFMEKTLTGATPLEIVTLEGINHFLPWNAKPVLDDAVARVADLMTGG